LAATVLVRDGLAAGAAGAVAGVLLRVATNDHGGWVSNPLALFGFGVLITALPKLLPYLSVLHRARHSSGLVGLLVRRPSVAAGVAAYETALLATTSVPRRLVALVQLKTSSLIGCPY
jgi:hypothetical protein